MTKTKTINVTSTTHNALRDYCRKTGQKVGHVADQAIQKLLSRRASK